MKMQTFRISGEAKVKNELFALKLNMEFDIPSADDTTERGITLMRLTRSIAPGLRWPSSRRNSGVVKVFPPQWTWRERDSGEIGAMPQKRSPKGRVS